ncbi:bifunctional salicylyl-CoA 5-hydroxylase/oxidoreductase [Massilia aurea]|uniref:bifunctional salicylyl-CoA 5-hydroxylase/oxidoreductase n=1 Tax=Massilia aurea TaxID=373040 RepID=UPI0034633D48
MNIVCVGGGPAGLYAGLLIKLRDPRHAVTVVERNRAGDTFGWGVVFSDQTLGKLALADAPSARAIEGAFNRWDAIDVHIRGATVTSHGHGFCGIARKRLLGILQARCEEAGVELVFGTEVADEVALAQRYGADLVVAADGVRSTLRSRHADVFQPDVEEQQCRYVWLGTRRDFSAFTFAFEETVHGWFQAHAYQYDDQNSTFIVETLDATWRASGLADMDADATLAFCERLFARVLGGAPLLTQAARGGAGMWSRFPRLACRQWVHAVDVDGRRVPLVLMGDAAHTAHFSIGSGTRLALEDAIALSAALSAAPDSNDDLDAGLLRYQAARVVEVLKLQSAARNSTEWFENVARYSAMPQDAFAYSLLTRSQRLSHENLRLRDPAYIDGFERRFARDAALQAGVGVPTTATPPMFTPFRMRGVVLKNRVVVSPMAQYSCIDGVAGDFHLAHLGARALGGAGLVMAEMTCVSADARITPRCPGLYLPQHTLAWRRIVDFVHAASDAKIGIQLGHAGAKGSTRPMWEGIDQPLALGNWPLVSASPQQYLAGVSQVAREANDDDMARIEADFVRATLAAGEAGFDWLELHCAHGYLLSSFISPLTNRRLDAYGGSLANRCRFPLRVFAAVRAAWPEHLPVSVRISSHDWVDGGITPVDAVEIARLFRAAGADMIDCSSGQVSKAEQPVYGRMYQTPFSDRIRNEAGIATIAVGGISEADHVNSIIAAGRADLCAVGRPHLANPAWTLNEAARIGYTGAAWPRQYAPGKQQLERNLARERQGM